jgi:hypothetical protein
MNWSPAFGAWIKRWCDRRLDPDWLAAYKKAFRAGWRAARQTAPRSIPSAATWPTVRIDDRWHEINAVVSELAGAIYVRCNIPEALRLFARLSELATLPEYAAIQTYEPRPIDEIEAEIGAKR